MTERIKELLKLAKKGDGMAQHNLAVMYSNSQIIPQDFVKAYMWARISEAYGHNDPGFLRYLEVWTTPSDRQKAEELMKRCIESKFEDCPE